jgi:hypothetical protein
VVRGEKAFLAVGELVVEGRARGAGALDDVRDRGVRVAVRAGVLDDRAQQSLALVGADLAASELVRAAREALGRWSRRS